MLLSQVAPHSRVHMRSGAVLHENPLLRGQPWGNFREAPTNVSGAVESPRGSIFLLSWKQNQIAEVVPNRSPHHDGADVEATLGFNWKSLVVPSNPLTSATTSSFVAREPTLIRKYDASRICVQVAFCKIESCSTLFCGSGWRLPADKVLEFQRAEVAPNCSRRNDDVELPLEHIDKCRA